MFLSRERNLVLLVYTLGLLLLFVPSIYSTVAQNLNKSKRLFTLDELAAFDGKEGRPAYYAYKGKIYDVTGSSLFKEGAHFKHQAGQDLTEALSYAPHGEEVFAPFGVVGVLDEGLKQPPLESEAKGKNFGPIIILGRSLTAWTGYLLGIFFIINFSTCYAMPWCHAHVPWKGDKPGHDPRDRKGYFRLLVSYHKPFAFGMAFFGITHGILGILQSFRIVL